MYWLIDDGNLSNLLKLSENSKLENSLSQSGDECHIDILGISDKVSKRFAEHNCKPPFVFMCLNDSCIQILNEDYENLATLYNFPE